MCTSTKFSWSKNRNQQIMGKGEHLLNGFWVDDNGMKPFQDECCSVTRHVSASLGMSTNETVEFGVLKIAGKCNSVKRVIGEINGNVCGRVIETPEVVICWM